MDRIRSNDQIDEIYARNKGKPMEQWQMNAILTGFIPPRTRSEYEATKKDHPEILAIEAKVEQIESAARAAIARIFKRGDAGTSKSEIEREACATLCETLDPVEGPKFAAAIRARAKCTCGSCSMTKH